MDLTAFGLFLGVALVQLLALCVLGYPVARLLRRLAKQPSIISLPLLGLFPLATCSWLWSTIGPGGLRTVLPVLVGLFSIATFGLLWRSGVRLRMRSIAWRDIGLTAAVLLGFLVLYWPYVHSGLVLPATLAGTDLPQFATAAEHLRRFGFDEPGNIAATDYGSSLYPDTVGSFFTALLPATLIDQPVWRTITATLAVGSVVLALQMRIMLEVVFRVSFRVAWLVALACSAAPLLVYSIGQGFLTQPFATALLVAGVSITLRLRGTRRSIKRTVGSLAVVFATLWYFYPFAVAAVLLLAGPILVLQRPVRQWIRVIGTLSLTAVLGLTIGALLAPTRVGIALWLAVDQQDAAAGWPLGVLRLEELLGDLGPTFIESMPHRAPYDYPPIERAFSGLGETAVVAVILLVCAVIALRRRTARSAVGLLVTTLASYVAVFLLTGTSYQQWKWAALITPILILSAVVIVGSAIAIALRGRGSTLTIVLCSVAGGAVFIRADVQLMGAAWWEGRSNSISADLIAVADDPRVRQPNTGIDTGIWDEMWLTAMLADYRTYQLGENYTPTVRATNLWSVQHAQRLLGYATASETEHLAGDYSLQLRKPNQDAGIDVQSVVAEDALTVSWRIRVTNNSSTTWRSTQDDPSNGVTIESTPVRVGPATALINGSDNVTIPQMTAVKYHPLPRGTVIRPGRSFVLEGKDAVADWAGMSMQFDVASASAGPFRIWTAATVAPIEGAGR